MNLVSELWEIKRHFISWCVLFIVLTIVFCFVPFRLVSYNDLTIPILALGVPGSSLSALFFIHIKNTVLPEGVSLFAPSPIGAFLLHLKISFMMSFVALFPYFVYSLSGYLAPALFPKERRKMLIFIVSMTGLFITGILFAYTFLVSPLFTTLLAFNVDLEIVPYLALDEFISWTLATIFMTGLLFLLPLGMYLLTALRLVKISFWIKKWKEACVFFLIVTAVITPDVSGFSLLALFLPASVLYSAGIALSYFHVRK